MQEGKKSGAGTVIYTNPDGTSHWRKGSWIDNDLRGEVEHYFSTNNRDGTSNLTKKLRKIFFHNVQYFDKLSVKSTYLQ